MNKLSDRIYNDSDAAPWVIDEIVKLEDEVERLQLAYDDQHAVASLMHQQAEKAEAEVERLLDLLERAGSCLPSCGLRDEVFAALDEVFAALDAARGES